MTKNDIYVLKQLAEKYMGYAGLPVQKEKIKLWEKLNRFEMERPLILFDQLPWHELDADGSLRNQAEDPYWRAVETELRQQIYKWEHMPGDMVLNPYITLPRPIAYSGYGVKAQVDTIQTGKAANALSQRFTNLFHGMEDIERIQTPKAVLDQSREDVIRGQAHVIFDGIADFRLAGMTLCLGFWDLIAQWMSVEQVYIDLMDRPELLHGMMEKLTVCTIQLIQQMSKDGLFDCYSNSCHCSHTYEGGFPPEGADLGRPSSEDAWAFGLAQLFTSVSPRVTKEFEVDYMKRIFPYFGRIYYGCCDRLDDRLAYILELPNVRKISCSPWSDRDIFAERLPRHYVMSNKPNPAFFAAEAFDIDVIKQDIAKTLQAAKRNNTNLELIFKDISTVKGRPQRLWDTAKAVVEMACDY